ncbi:phosphatidylserine decarboxylase [Candidatus Kryptonium thompsonii]|uniref:Phosphatidylserine decarboxylase proenzyme n=1 Tax=Candidatus Kryptonium thompsonii TaxID=1633631 RepID=A0A0P1M4I9_9BACT|nr:phosphatidylserine decarboxylase family protein [Candidatus Kryptonium thompsoni]CUS78312.1 phosphatidylserine decarboxylase [Candidatus Kryptonium thompsoni]CUS81156.1 phosphatidylserine decarboxylase [Candidatus Kryptonium thompsoni]CUS89480.1 phosphatidylserine decarboxylase [Candidatus Kryptonium thompsoni]CUS90610.1 phosphatidylserine decarboxylase [Candidatus Kryptonium thompsoni]CUU05219.1 phosphatidylserine decarboxylase [Candidatus Kryptonium thompsoni]
MIAKYGISTVAWIIVFSIALLIISLLIKPVALKALTFLLAILISGFTLFFFRDPERKTPNGDDLIISPADGKVFLIRELFENEFILDDAIQISIFMSPLNVHVNRIPISGEVKFLKYIPGKYIVAFEEKSSENNERKIIGIETGDGLKIMVKQIAGFIARRIVCEVKKGDKVKTGQRYGMIKFGSRVDVIMPKNKVEILVSIGQKVKAGETIIAKVKR